MVERNSALACEAFSAFSFASCSSVFLSCNSSFAFALKLLFLYSESVNKESISIKAMLSQPVSFPRKSDCLFWSSRLFDLQWFLLNHQLQILPEFHVQLLLDEFVSRNPFGVDKTSILPLPEHLFFQRLKSGN